MHVPGWGRRKGLRWGGSRVGSRVTRQDTREPRAEHATSERTLDAQTAAGCPPRGQARRLFVGRPHGLFVGPPAHVDCLLGRLHVRNVCWAICTRGLFVGQSARADCLLAGQPA
eukprot:366360-Chlamydomonas_euryale.AAC.20